MFPVLSSVVVVAALSVGIVAVRGLDVPQSPAAPAASNAAMAKAAAELKHFGKPDEVRTFPKGRVELVKIGGATIGRAIFEPGWRWSTSVQPLAKTKSC